MLFKVLLPQFGLQHNFTVNRMKIKLESFGSHKTFFFFVITIYILVRFGESINTKCEIYYQINLKILFITKNNCYLHYFFYNTLQDN
jgi:hypothetical protein